MPQLSQQVTQQRHLSGECPTSPTGRSVPIPRLGDLPENRRYPGFHTHLPRPERLRLHLRAQAELFQADRTIQFSPSSIIILIMLSVQVLKASHRTAAPKHSRSPKKRLQEQHHLSSLFLPVIPVVGYGSRGPGKLNCRF